MNFVKVEWDFIDATEEFKTLHSANSEFSILLSKYVYIFVKQQTWYSYPSAEFKVGDGVICKKLSLS